MIHSTLIAKGIAEAKLGKTKLHLADVRNKVEVAEGKVVEVEKRAAQSKD